MSKKNIVGIGGLLLCVLFFTAPLVQCSQNSSYDATGLEISVGTGKLMSQADVKYPYVFLLLLLPIILVIVGFTKKPFDVLRNVSIWGLIAHVAFMIGAYVKLNSGDTKGAFELTAANWLIIGIYIGLIGFSQYCINTGQPEESNVSRTRSRSNYSGTNLPNRKCRQCETIYSGSLTSCPKCNSSLYEETNQSQNGETWTCKKCGEKNPITASTCKDCGAYK